MLKTLLKFRPKKYTECRKKEIHTKLEKETEDLIWIRTFIMVVTTAKVLVGNTRVYVGFYFILVQILATHVYW